MLKIKIDFLSFLKKGLPNDDSDFLIALITGYQGSGKTYYAIKKMEELKQSRKIVTNIKSYRSLKHDIVYFDSISDLYNNHDLNTIFLIDELSKRYTKDSKIDKAFYSWLQQSRKHNRQVYLITQEYLQVPQWLRGIANTIYTSHKYPLLPICSTSYGVPVLDKDTMEWGIEEFGIYFYKRTKSIGRLYDTYELIDDL